MSVYVIAQSKIENTGLLDQYGTKVVPTIESRQGGLSRSMKNRKWWRERLSIRGPSFSNSH
jgi:hypothetical protein